MERFKYASLCYFCMRIDFNDTIEGKDRLQPFITEQAPIIEHMFGPLMGDANKCKRINLSVDTYKLETTLVDVLESSFTKNAFQVKRSASNTIWVSSPLQFSLRVDGKQYGRQDIPHALPSNLQDNYELLQVETVEHHGKLLWFSYKTGETKTTTYRQIPRVAVTGSILFEQLKGIEPSPVLDILKKLGYAASVIPTPKELGDLLQAMQRTVDCDGSSGYRSSRDDDGLITGGPIGTFLGSLGL